MANGRSVGRKGDVGRDSGGFVALPWSVLDSASYARLSHPARALLLEFARQFVRDNNGRLLCSMRHLRARGWKSADVVTRAKRELLESGFIYETVIGGFPSRAAWYAVTWRALDPNPRYDSGATAGFERGAYARTGPTTGNSLIPRAGTGKVFAALPNGTRTALPVPPAGAVGRKSWPNPVPPSGNHLEMPSVAATKGAFDDQTTEPQSLGQRGRVGGLARATPIQGQPSGCPPIGADLRGMARAQARQDAEVQSLGAMT